MTRFPRIAIVIAVILAAALVPVRAQILVNGAGATFPYPIYARWFDEYYRLHPQARINYQAIGSGVGARQLINGTIDFGASDRPMTDAQLAESPVSILHFPTVLGAVVPIYNLPGVGKPLDFTPEALAGIFVGATTRWNAPELVRNNSNPVLPDAEIVPIHRSDGSGTTFIWTEFLSKTSARWQRGVGAGTSVRWPVGLGVRGNEGVAGLVKQTPYSIGYVELAYAVQNRIPYGRLQNASGQFVAAEARTMTLAAASVSDRMPIDLRVSITNPPGRNAYPAASFTWLLTPQRIEDPEKRKAITGFLIWALTEGQRLAEPLGYAPLPGPIASKARAAVSRIR